MCKRGKYLKIIFLSPKLGRQIRQDCTEKTNDSIQESSGYLLYTQSWKIMELTNAFKPPPTGWRFSRMTWYIKSYAVVLLQFDQGDLALSKLTIWFQVEKPSPEHHFWYLC